MAAALRSRQLSEQVPPRRLQELRALDDPSPTSTVRRSIRDNVNFGGGKEQSYRAHVGERNPHIVF
jgi:hypothetical protein